MPLRLCILALLASLSGCLFDIKGGGTDTEGVTPLTLSGRVLTDSGSTKAGTLVKLVPASYDPSKPQPNLIRTTVTDSNGKFTFKDLPKDSLFNIIGADSGRQFAFTDSLKPDTNQHTLTLSDARVFNVAVLTGTVGEVVGPIKDSNPTQFYFPGTDIIATVGEDISSLDTIPVGLESIGMANGTSTWRYSVAPTTTSDTLLVLADTLLVETNGSNMMLTPQRAWIPVMSQPFAAPGPAYAWKTPTSRFHMANGKGLELYVTNEAGLYRSEDEGETWEAIQDLRGSKYSTLAADSTGLVIINRMLSQDRGETWKEFGKCQEICDTLPPMAIGLAPKSTILLGGPFDTNLMMILKTTDFGKTSPPTYYALGHSFAPAAFTVSDKGLVYMGMTSSGIVTSSDQGGTWYAKNTQVNNYGAGIVPTGMAAANLSSLRTSKAGVLYAGYMRPSAEIDMGTPKDTTSPGLFRFSSDLMSSAAVSGNFHTSGVTCMERGPAGALFVGTWGKGIYRSFDGRTWIPFNQGLGSLYILSMALNAKGTLFAQTRDGMMSLKNAEGTTYFGQKRVGHAPVVSKPD